MARKKNELFIQIKHDLYDTKLWRGMHWYSKLAYLRIKRKYNPKKKEEITVSYKEMRDEMTNSTFAKAIRELENKGFINITQKGGLHRRRNFYTLSEEWRLKRHTHLVDIHKGHRGVVVSDRKVKPTAPPGVVSEK